MRSVTGTVTAIACVLAVGATVGAAPAVDGDAFVDARPGVPAGHVEAASLPSRVYGRTRNVWVYMPPGYDRARSRPYDLLVCFDAAYYRDEIPLATILDNLQAAGKIAPTVAILIDNSIDRLGDLANRRRFADFVGDELVPWARGRWNLTREAGRSILCGASAGGLAAAYVALARPELFGNVLSQSGAFWRGNEGSNGPPYEWLAQQVASWPQRAVRFYLEVGGEETAHAVGVGPVFIEAHRRLRDALRARGYDVVGVEVPHARHEPAHWRRLVAPGLISLTSRWAH